MHIEMIGSHLNSKTIASTLPAQIKINTYNHWLTKYDTVLRSAVSGRCSGRQEEECAVTTPRRVSQSARSFYPVPASQPATADMVTSEGMEQEQPVRPCPGSN